MQTSEHRQRLLALDKLLMWCKFFHQPQNSPQQSDQSAEKEKEEGERKKEIQEKFSNKPKLLKGMYQTPKRKLLLLR